MHSFGTPSITPYSAIPPSCPVLSTAPVVVAIGPAGSVPIGQGDPRGTDRSAVRSGPSEVRSELWSDSGFGLWGRTLGSDFGVGLWEGYTDKLSGLLQPGQITTGTLILR